MLEVTASAIGAMKRAIDGSKGEAKGIRISLIPGSCAEMKFKLDLEPEAKTSDDVQTCDGFAIFIDPAAAPLINGTRVDYVDSLDGGAFTFQNPQAESTCVCGKSFTPSTIS